MLLRFFSHCCGLFAFVDFSFWIILLCVRSTQLRGSLCLLHCLYHRGPWSFSVLGKLPNYSMGDAVNSRAIAINTRATNSRLDPPLTFPPSVFPNHLRLSCCPFHARPYANSEYFIWLASCGHVTAYSIYRGVGFRGA